MSIKFTTKLEGDFMHVKAWGKDEGLEDVYEYNSGVLEAALEAGVLKALCDERDLEYDLGTVRTFEGAKEMSDTIPVDAKVAIVANAKNRKEALFWETVSRNRGLNLKVFFDIDRARKWIE